MSDDPTPLAQIRFLARADSRVDVLDYLADSGPATRRELRSELDAARTTVARAQQSLVEAGWVEHADDGVQLTHAGRIVAVEFGSLVDTMRTVDDLAEFLRWFPSAVDAPDFHRASDVEVTTPTDADPYAPARKQSEILYSADRLRFLLPATDRESTATIVEEVTERGLEAETVVSPGVEATFEADEFAPLVREMVATGRSTIYVSPDPLPFYLGLADDGRVQVGLADDDGLPRALLETTDDAIREWAERVYADHLERARHKSFEEF